MISNKMWKLLKDQEEIEVFKVMIETYKGPLCLICNHTEIYGNGKLLWSEGTEKRIYNETGIFHFCKNLLEFYSL